MNYMLPPAIQGQMMRDPRLALALQQQQTGTSSAPAQTWGEGLARALQAPIGAMMQRNVMQDYQGQADSYQKAMADALSAYGRGDIEGAAAAAGQNPFLQELGANLTIKGADMKSRERLAEQAAAQRAAIEQARIERDNQRFEQSETAAERRHRERMEAADARAARSGKSEVTYTQPVAGVDEAGNPVFIRFEKGSPQPVPVEGFKPPPKTTAAAYSPKELQTARGKVEVATRLKEQIANAKAKFDAIRDSFSAGPGAGFVPSPKGKQFDAAIDDLRSTVTALTRVPGVGAMSDFETRLDQAKLPSRGEYEDVIEQKLNQLEALANSVSTGYAGILDEAGVPGAGVGSIDSAPSGQWSIRKKSQ